LIVNWTCLLTAPIWIGFYVMWCFLKHRDTLSVKARRGDVFFWES
jgi:hypothetical protein